MLPRRRGKAFWWWELTKGPRQFTVCVMLGRYGRNVAYCRPSYDGSYTSSASGDWPIGFLRNRDYAGTLSWSSRSSVCSPNEMYNIETDGPCRRNYAAFVVVDSVLGYSRFGERARPKRADLVRRNPTERPFHGTDWPEKMEGYEEFRC